MVCVVCGQALGTTDRRRRYCSDECRTAPKGSVPQLRIVEADEPVPLPPAESPLQPRTLPVDVAAREGTDLEFLFAIRDRIAEQVAHPACPPRELASLTKRLTDIRREITVERARLSQEAKDAADIPDEEWDQDAV